MRLRRGVAEGCICGRANTSQPPRGCKTPIWQKWQANASSGRAPAIGRLTSAFFAEQVSADKSQHLNGRYRALQGLADEGAFVKMRSIAYAKPPIAIVTKPGAQAESIYPLIRFASQIREQSDGCHRNGSASSVESTWYDCGAESQR
jgi:hypothetical protein